MQATKNAAAALASLVRVVLTALAIAILYVGRDVLIPLALASLLAFVLSPLVTRIERWIGRVAGVLIVVAMLFSVTGAVGWVLARQFVNVGTKLPDYQVNIENKLRAFRFPRGGAFTRLSQMIEDLTKEAPNLPPRAESGATSANASPTPVPVHIVDLPRAGPTGLVQKAIVFLFGPLGKTAIVLLLLIFMLLQREDIRGRLIRLIGRGDISATTHAMDDAGRRVARYLLMQLFVNITFGICVATGLYFIGTPHALLWGGMAAVLRFIPYIGVWIGAAFPTALSLAVSTNWTGPLLTVGLFAVLELINANAVEPWLYGSSTGVTPIALVVGAVFWTWVWGPVGLFLTTPLMVCLAVMGRHVPNLGFLNVLLSDERALAPHEECYNRLLALDPNEPGELIDSYLESQSLTALYDGVIIPVIRLAEMDHLREALDEKQYVSILQSVRDIVEDLGSRSIPQLPLSGSHPEPAPGSAPRPSCRVFCVPARAERDELAGIMLTHLLDQQGFVVAKSAKADIAVAELLDIAGEMGAEELCISVVAPSTIIQARYLCIKFRARFPELKIVIGLWGTIEKAGTVAERLRASGADAIAVSLADAVVHLRNLCVPPRGKNGSPPPAALFQP